MDIQQQAADFFTGAAILDKLAGWAFVTANRESILGYLIAFSAAYEQLAELRAAGKVGAGDADFSEENRERVKRIIALLQSGLDSDEARAAAREVHLLAERCLLGLKQSEPESSECEVRDRGE